MHRLACVVYLPVQLRPSGINRLTIFCVHFNHLIYQHSVVTGCYIVTIPHELPTCKVTVVDPGGSWAPLYQMVLYTNLKAKMVNVADHLVSNWGYTIISIGDP